MRSSDLKIEKLKHSPDYRDRSVDGRSVRSLRLALFISKRENVSTRYVCTFILLPFVAGFNLQRLVIVVYFIVAYDAFREIFRRLL